MEIETQSSSTEDLIAYAQACGAERQRNEALQTEAHDAVASLVERLNAARATRGQKVSAQQSALESAVREATDNPAADFVGMEEIVMKAGQGIAFATKLEEYITHEALPPARLRAAQADVDYFASCNKCWDAFIARAQEQLDNAVAAVSATQGVVFAPTSALISDLTRQRSASGKAWEDAISALRDLEIQQRKDRIARESHGAITTQQVRFAM